MKPIEHGKVTYHCLIRIDRFVERLPIEELLKHLLDFLIMANIDTAQQESEDPQQTKSTKNLAVAKWA